jgi:hypothetical protein
MIDSYSSHRRLAEDRPVKARRYAKSIQDTLKRGVGELETARLRDALRGIEDGLRMHGTVCSTCGRELSDPESIARGVGPDCAERLAAAS